MQHGVGAFPKGQCRTLRSHDSWKAPDDIIAQEVSWSGLGGPLEQLSHWEIVLKIQESIWNRRLSKGSASPRATNDSWKAPEAIYDLEAWENVE